MHINVHVVQSAKCIKFVNIIKNSVHWKICLSMRNAMYRMDSVCMYVCCV